MNYFQKSVDFSGLLPCFKAFVVYCRNEATFNEAGEIKGCISGFRKQFKFHLRQSDTKQKKALKSYLKELSFLEKMIARKEDNQKYRSHITLMDYESD